MQASKTKRFSSNWSYAACHGGWLSKAIQFLSKSSKFRIQTLPKKIDRRQLAVRENGNFITVNPLPEWIFRVSIALKSVI